LWSGLVDAWHRVTYDTRAEDVERTSYRADARRMTP
jgi:hypothetical protein